MSLDLSKWLPKFLQDGLIGPPALWGKLPSRADFIRHNLKHDQGEALQAWITAQLCPPVAIASRTAVSPVQGIAPVARISPGRRKDASLWHDLNPSMRSTSEANTTGQGTIGHAGLPWCFVLPPGSLSFAKDDHVIGVWMASSDKVGRQYPLLMMQTAAPRWVKQYFSQHTRQPCDWLHAVARAMAKTVYADETQADRPTGDGQAKDHLHTLTMQIDSMWQTIRPGWSEIFGRAATTFDARSALALIGEPHPADPIPYLDGVRHLPWSDWPQKLTAQHPQPAFWQQDLQGRFVAAAVSLHSLTSFGEHDEA